MNIKKGKIISVYGSKGGCGKTITTLNLAYAFKELSKKVLILDFDLYSGNVATYLNLDVNKTIHHLTLDLSNNKYENFNDYISRYDDNIDIISSVKDPREASKIDAKYIPLILRNAVYKYDVILIDTTHVLNDVTILSLDNSDKICYVLTNDLFDLKNTRSFFAITKDINYDNITVLLNEAINPTKTYFSLYDIRSMVKKNVDFTIPKNMFLRNIDYYLMDGNLLFENKSVPQSYKKEKNKFIEIAKSLIKEGDEK